MTTKDEARERRAAGRARRRADNGTVEHGDERSGVSQDALRLLASAAARGAAQALAERRRRRPDEELTEEPTEEPTDEPTESVPAAETPEPEPEPEAAAEPEPEPQPVAAGEIQKLVRSARAVLRDLTGSDAESVSSVSRTTNGWSIGLEVVELRRVPDSMDVLASYDVEVDGDGNVLGFERRARYTRSQAGRRGQE